jgi:hypothetical protein
MNFRKLRLSEKIVLVLFLVVVSVCGILYAKTYSQRYNNIKVTKYLTGTDLDSTTTGSYVVNNESGEQYGRAARVTYAWKFRTSTGGTGGGVVASAKARGLVRLYASFAGVPWLVRVDSCGTATAACSLTVTIPPILENIHPMGTDSIAASYAQGDYGNGAGATTQWRAMDDWAMLLAADKLYFTVLQSDTAGTGSDSVTSKASGTVRIDYEGN